MELSLDPREVLIQNGRLAKAARTDIVAGVALAGLLVPEGMAYAGIAGVPPQMGLYAAVAGMFVYAIFGSSRQLAVTPTSSSAAMLAALVAPIALGNPTKYALLASAATIAAGLIFLVGGMLKLGSVSEFISKPCHRELGSQHLVSSSASISSPTATSVNRGTETGGRHIGDRRLRVPTTYRSRQKINSENPSHCGGQVCLSRRGPAMPFSVICISIEE